MLYYTAFSVHSIAQLKSSNTRKIENGAIAHGGHDETSPLPSISISTISIKELLELVNDRFADVLSKDVLEHFGIEREKNEVGESVKHSLRESIEDYEEENERLREKIDKLRVILYGIFSP